MFSKTLSTMDRNRGIRIPENMDENLAEDIGFHIGDGCLYVSERKSSYQITYSMNYIEDFDYSIFIINLKNKLFGIKPRISKVGNELRLVIFSKTLVEFYSKNIGLPVGKKDNLQIPKIVMEAKKTRLAFLRGIFDTDFSLSFKKKEYSDVHKYPVMMSDFNNPNLMNGLYDLLKSLGFKPSKCKVLRYDKRTNKNYPSYQIYLNGEKNVLRWWKSIKSHNPRLITRYKLWKRFGFCPSNMSIDQRYEALNGKINLMDFYK